MSLAYAYDSLRWRQALRETLERLTAAASSWRTRPSQPRASPHSRASRCTVLDRLTLDVQAAFLPPSPPARRHRSQISSRLIQFLGAAPSAKNSCALADALEHHEVTTVEKDCKPAGSAIKFTSAHAGYVVANIVKEDDLPRSGFAPLHRLIIVHCHSFTVNVNCKRK